MHQDLIASDQVEAQTSLVVGIEAREVLAHVPAVAISKVHRNEGFVLSWTESPAQGSDNAHNPKTAAKVTPVS